MSQPFHTFHDLIVYFLYVDSIFSVCIQTFQRHHNMNTKPLYQEIIYNPFTLSFKLLYGGYQYIVENYYVNCIDKYL